MFFSLVRNYQEISYRMEARWWLDHFTSTQEKCSFPWCTPSQIGKCLQQSVTKGVSAGPMTYAAIAEALYQGGIDGFLLETMNYWDEALMALQGVEKFIKKVRIYTSNLMPFL